MTKEQKKERRQVRHELQNAARQHLTVEFRLTSTPAQQKSAAKIIADKLFAGKNPSQAKTLPGFGQ